MAILSCLAGSGAVQYSKNGNYGNDGSGGGSSWGGSGGGGGGGSGGVGGGGSIWSDSSQLIWITINNAPKYPIWLNPGYNDVHFWIPLIFPDDEWIEAPLIIEAPGYILIPAGFEFTIKTDKDAPVKIGNPKMIDKIKFVDLYDYDIINVPVPVDLDSLLDTMQFDDLYDTDTAHVISEQSEIDTMQFDDLYDTDTAHVISEQSGIDTMQFDDLYDTDTAHVISEQSDNDNVGFSDFINIE